MNPTVLLAPLLFVSTENIGVTTIESTLSMGVTLPSHEFIEPCTWAPTGEVGICMRYRSVDGAVTEIFILEGVPKTVHYDDGNTKSTTVDLLLPDP